jgi:GDP/UDP-N,N'-diacetylbacillosamine 2-epimerase (hydrolysing)
MVKVGVLTSSRADYGIYKSLLSALHVSEDFELITIVFGNHFLKEMSNSLQEIKNDSFGSINYVGSFYKTNSPEEVVELYGKIIQFFSIYWKETSYDIIFAIGDRFEMAAAVQATIPFGIKIAHLHGGEITLGSIDNIYRDQISIASSIHFTATETYSNRLKNLLNQNQKIFNVGALSLVKLPKNNVQKWTEVREKFSIPNKKFILITFHPETSTISTNKKNIIALKGILKKLCEEFHLLITGTNSDQNHLPYVQLFTSLKQDYLNDITLVSSLGRENYFSALYNCSFVMGNSSSGIIEAASFEKFNLNLGNRQKGRLMSNNSVTLPFCMDKISKQIEYWRKLNFKYKGANIYAGSNTLQSILNQLNNC